MSVARILRDWLNARKAKARARELARIEQARAATIKAIAYRQSKHAASSPKRAELFHHTCRSLAASCGREWPGRTA